MHAWKAHQTKLAYLPSWILILNSWFFFFPANSRTTGLEENMKAQDVILQLLESVIKIESGDSSWFDNGAQSNYCSLWRKQEAEEVH